MRWTVGRKLGLVGGALIVLVLALGVVNLFLNEHTLDSVGEAATQAEFAQKKSSVLASRAQEAKLAVTQVQESLTDISVTRAAPGFDNGFEVAAEAAANFRTIMDEFQRAHSEENDLDQLRELAELRESFEAFYAKGQEMAKAYVSGGTEAGNPYMAEFDPFVESLETRIDTLVKQQKSRFEESMSRIGKEIWVAETNANGLKTVSWVAMVISTVIIAFLVIAIMGITGPIRRAAQFANALAEGDLSQEIDIKTQDEIGDMAKAFQVMVTALAAKAEVAKQLALGNVEVEIQVISHKDVLGQAMVVMKESLKRKAAMAHELAKGNLSAEVESMSEVDVLGQAMQTMKANNREVLTQLKEVVLKLAANAPEIASTAAEAASTSVQQAATVSQVSATAEELSHSAAATAQEAKDVVAAAQLAVADGNTGLEAVDAAIAVMRILGETSEETSARIHALNEQGNKIGEIVETVGGLAEQSNLLAVNASIEAAKAGEHGRGFAVVASEVRNLAEQSKRATKQIRRLLKDIESASRSAIVSTEEGRRCAAEGADSIESVRSVIAQLAQVLDENSDRAKRISEAAKDQVVGVVQVSEAMRDMAKAGYENSQGAKNLESSAGQIYSLVQQLEAISSRYTF